MNVERRALAGELIPARSRVLDYIELMKPELTGLSALTALCGFYLGSIGSMSVPLFFWTAFGTICLGGGAGALNQYIERDLDAVMKRTEKRPLPAGRITPESVLFFGLTLAIVGIVILGVFANLLTGFLAALTLVSYLFVYTPLKRLTPWSTIIGGIPGALPPMMGWSAAAGEVALGAWVLFAILFFWQMPHFFSLAWMYRRDYARAGFRILSVLDTRGHRTGTQCLLHTAALLPASIALSIVGVTGGLYFLSAVILGAVFLLFSVLFARNSRASLISGASSSNALSRKVFFASLVYLPALMAMMVIDKL